jgi:hypothetical protein
LESPNITCNGSPEDAPPLVEGALLFPRLPWVAAWEAPGIAAASVADVASGETTWMWAGLRGYVADTAAAGGDVDDGDNEAPEDEIAAEAPGLLAIIVRIPLSFGALLLLSWMAEGARLAGSLHACSSWSRLARLLIGTDVPVQYSVVSSLYDIVCFDRHFPLRFELGVGTSYKLKLYTKNYRNRSDFFDSVLHELPTCFWSFLASDRLTATNRRKGGKQDLCAVGCQSSRRRRQPSVTTLPVGCFHFAVLTTFNNEHARLFLPLAASKQQGTLRRCDLFLHHELELSFRRPHGRILSLRSCIVADLRRSVVGLPSGAGPAVAHDAPGDAGGAGA